MTYYGLPNGFEAAQRAYDNMLPPDDDLPDDYDPETDHDCYPPEDDFDEPDDPRDDSHFGQHWEDYL